MKMKKNPLNQLFVALYRLPWVKALWSKRFQAVQGNTIPWTPLSKPLADCRIALVTTGGVHLQSDPPFDMSDKQGDPSFRRFPATVNVADLQITHDYYDHRDADEDINLVIPFDILREFQAAGRLGPAADYFYSFMGHLEPPHVETLINETAQVVAQELKQQAVDVVLLVPA